MTGFTLQLQGATQHEQLDSVTRFCGEDDSGQFSLMRHHAHFITTLVFGLARLQYADQRWEYLALPGAVLQFKDNQLTLSTRRYLRGDDYRQIEQALREELVAEEQALGELKQSLGQMEQAMMQRLWKLGVEGGPRP